ncbi:MAG TPA: hypothetical protein PLH06_06360, partial [Candidatus Hydrogenedentes bacterium]|nr:hypothetical protein [Candidatus Hydrogenedentota bacterium]
MNRPWLLPEQDYAAATAMARALGGDMSVRDPLAMAYGALMEAYWAQKQDDPQQDALASEAFM